MTALSAWSANCVRRRSPDPVAAVIRHRRFWPNDQHQPLARGDRVLNFLMKRQPARRHRHAVKPNFETAGREILVQPGHEGRCRIERIDIITACVEEDDAGRGCVATSSSGMRCLRA